ncbi:pyocin activator PrtN family protein [Comamonas aquatica]|nr:pyocin activator PrtN family protein [Comamonas aquatica]
MADLCNKAGQRSPWFIDAKKLADYIDSKKREAENDWQKMRA